MVASVASDTFSNDVSEIANYAGPCTDEIAEAFFAKHTLQDVFSKLSARSCPEAAIKDASIALDRLLDTNYGTGLLSQTEPLAQAALGAQHPLLRRLGARQLGRTLMHTTAVAVGTAPGSAAESLGGDAPKLVHVLIAALKDIDTGVASVAENALVKYGKQPAGMQLLTSPEGGRDALVHLLGVADALTRTRALAVLVNLAAVSPMHAAELQRAGLLDMEAMLSSLGQASDVLGALAALQLLEDLSRRCDAGAAALLSPAALPQLLALSQDGDPMLQAQALQVAAALSSSAAVSDSSPMDVDGAPPPSSQLLDIIRCILEHSGERSPIEVEVAALEAIATLGEAATAAQQLLISNGALLTSVASTAFSRSSVNASLRLAALHALAVVAGSKRADDARAAAAAQLSAPAEVALRSAVYMGASNRTPAEAFLSLLQQPVLELRVAAYRALSTLSVRQWCAAEVAAHRPLLDRLADPRSESSAQACHWRFATVQALDSVTRRIPTENGEANGGGPLQSALRSAASQIAVAVREGPFGGGRVVSRPAEMETMS